MRVIVCLLMTLALSLCSSVRAATNLDTSVVQKLVQLECKYFGHSFDGDSDDRRTQRLEKSIFGEALTGDLSQRIKNMPEATVTSSAKSSDEVTAAHPTPLQTVETDTASTSETEIGEADYPRITTLEKEILGQSFVGQPLMSRLSRMETKAFGKPSGSNDLGQRTDSLENYAETKLHIKPVEEADGQETTISNTQVNSEPTDYPRITALEKAILGQGFVGQPLADRLSRMESKAFGSPSKSDDLSQRTDNLERYAETKLHKKPVDHADRKETATSEQGSMMKKQIIAAVGNTLLGVAGLGGMGGVMPGMTIGPRFGGGRMRSGQSNSQQQPTPTPEVHPEDPMVHSANPPPTGAKLITKVGWCEVQVFGHTFPDMHLAERLGQLNTELMFEPGKSGIVLMDDINALIKAVQANKVAKRMIDNASKTGLPN